VTKGYRVVFTPYAKLYHFHNSTFNRNHDMGHERAEFLRRWQAWVDLDPYCGTHLAPLCREDSSLSA
jgi:GT2 family glycosyltransferase